MILSAEQLYEDLSRLVIGQEEAKRLVCNALTMHKLKHIKADVYDEEYGPKSNCMLMGPSGCGKTYIIEQACRLSNLPFISIDAKTLSQHGYVGQWLEDYLYDLFDISKEFYPKPEKPKGNRFGITSYYDMMRVYTEEKAYNNLPPDLKSYFDESAPSYSEVKQSIKEHEEYLEAINNYEDDIDVMAQRGVVFIDEIDKICIKNISSTGSDHNFSILSGLLKAIEGTVMDLSTNSKKGTSRIIDTSGLLFIFGGNFEALRTTRKLRKKTSLGFVDNSEVNERTYQQELIEFGVMVEFIGRIAQICEVKELTKQQLKDILYKGEESPFRKYRSLFNYLNTDFRLNESEADALVEEAIKAKTGVRGLKTLVDKKAFEKLSEFGDIEISL